MKKLTRSIHNRMVAGVCAGIGNYFNVDPTIIRIVTVLLAFVTSIFPVVVAYIVLAIIIPNEGEQV